MITVYDFLSCNLMLDSLSVERAHGQRISKSTETIKSDQQISKKVYQRMWKSRASKFR